MYTWIRKYLLALAAATVLALAGCATSKTDSPSDAGSSGPAGAETTTYGIEEQDEVVGQEGNVVEGVDVTVDETVTVTDEVVYFAFDSSAIESKYDENLQKAGKFLAAHPGSQVRLEGNADDRGTREYNMALGERRARAVAVYLQSQGASMDQMDVISYGEERPAVLGQTESARSKNRRVNVTFD